MACTLKYYEDSRHDLLDAAICWDQLRHFDDRQQALDQAKKDNNDGNCPKVNKQVSMGKWVNAFGICLERQIGRLYVP